MRKVKLMMQMTINGFAAGLNGESDWMTWTPDPELMAFMNTQYDSSDTLLLGRKTASFFINYWESAFAKDPNTPFAKKIVDLPKVVFSRTLEESTWNNTTLAKGNFVEEISNLKKRTGKDILILGSPTFVSSLVKEGLIDEYTLIINPTAMANGISFFDSLNSIQKFTPVQSKLYPGGKTVLVYHTKNE